VSATAPTTDHVTTPEQDLDQPMSVMEHLKELRFRLGVIIASVMLGFMLCTFVPIPLPGVNPNDVIMSPVYGWTTIASEVVRVIVAPVKGNVQAIQPGETLFTYFKISLLTGVALAMPIIVYQIMQFVLPALLPHERRYLYLLLPGVCISFVIGAGFAYLFILPAMVKFLLGFGAQIVEIKWAFSEYLDLFGTVIFWMGVVFEMPLIIYFLVKLGIVSAKRLAGFRRYMFVLAFVMGAFITPTPDPFNQALVSVPIYLLFELGILMARIF